jgi:hypothetical protein
MKQVFLVLTISATFLVLAKPEQANATTLDLSAVGSSGGPINGALFARTNIYGQGAGNFDPFLRIQGDNNQQRNPNGNETGYNTDGSPVWADTTSGGSWTHSILLSQVPQVTINSILYREFLLNANENSHFFLNTIDIYLEGSANLTGDPSGFPSGTDNRKYTLGSNNIKLDNTTGSGLADLFIYIPDANFTGSNNYVYFVSQLSNTGGGAELFGVRGGVTDPTVPEPATLSLLGLGLVGVLIRKKR